MGGGIISKAVGSRTRLLLPPPHEKEEAAERTNCELFSDITSERGNHVYEKRVESLFKYEKGIAQFFFLSTFFFRLYNFFCDVPGESERASECTHPYKRKIEASVDGGWQEGGWVERGEYISEGKAERTTGFARYIIRIDILRFFFIIKYIEGAGFLFWSVKSWCLQSKHIVPAAGNISELSVNGKINFIVRWKRS